MSSCDQTRATRSPCETKPGASLRSRLPKRLPCFARDSRSPRCRGQTRPNSTVRIIDATSQRYGSGETLEIVDHGLCDEPRERLHNKQPRSEDLFDSGGFPAMLSLTTHWSPSTWVESAHCNARWPNTTGTTPRFARSQGHGACAALILASRRQGTGLPCDLSPSPHPPTSAVPSRGTAPTTRTLP